MNILAIDTALGACSVAFGDSGGVKAHRHEPMARGHAEKLAPMVAAVMAEAQMPFPAIDRLAVTTGPGTFTGQRVGLAFVRALVVALRKPVVGVTTLAAMAEDAFARGDETHCIVASDARREEVYLGMQARDGSAVIAPEVIAYPDIAARLAPLSVREVVLAGTAAVRVGESLRDTGWTIRDSGIRQPDARAVLALAARLPARDTPPSPLYLRAPDAKLPVIAP